MTDSGFSGQAFSGQNIEPSPPESGPPPNAAWLSATLRALRHRNFQLFFSGQLISLIGTWMQTIAESWLVYRLTGSPLLLGAAGFASQFPVFLVAPLGGIVADRFNRQRVVIGTQISSMILASDFCHPYPHRSGAGVADLRAGGATGRGQCF